MLAEELKWSGSSKRFCKQCGRFLLDEYKEEICPDCQELNLFSEVKDYIRENDVRESDVAEHFGLPVTKVRRWIREGRIQYKGVQNGLYGGVHCQLCGKPIDFGTICPDCHRAHNIKGVATVEKAEDKSVMRFLNK